MAIFLDMDGVLAQFYKDPDFMQNMHKEGYFIGLQPYEPMCRAMKYVASTRDDVYILTAYHTEDPWAKTEKTLWVKHIFGEDFADFNLIICPCGANKAEYAEAKLGRKICKYDVLVDDHTPNLLRWEASGGLGIKFINEINGHGGKWTGYRLPHTTPYGPMMCNIAVRGLCETAIERNMRKDEYENLYNRYREAKSKAV